jgi:hypothetical protein
MALSKNHSRLSQTMHVEFDMYKEKSVELYTQLQREQLEVVDILQSQFQSYRYYVFYFICEVVLFWG